MAELPEQRYPPRELPAYTQPVWQFAFPNGPEAAARVTVTMPAFAREPDTIPNYDGQHGSTVARCPSARCGGGGTVDSGIMPTHAFRRWQGQGCNRWQVMLDGHWQQTLDVLDGSGAQTFDLPNSYYDSVSGRNVVLPWSEPHAVWLVGEYEDRPAWQYWPGFRLQFCFEVDPDTGGSLIGNTQSWWNAWDWDRAHFYPDGFKPLGRHGLPLPGSWGPFGPNDDPPWFLQDCDAFGTWETVTIAAVTHPIETAHQPTQTTGIPLLATAPTLTGVRIEGVPVVGQTLRAVTF